MNEVDDQPGVGRGMTELTGRSCIQVTNILTGSADTVVTTFTIVTDPCVGEIRDLPTTGGMANIAGLRSDNVRSGFTGRADPVVAGLTGATDHIGVIKKDQQPTLGDMAGVTRIVGGNMAGMLACCDITVVTAFTGAGHLAVIYVTDPGPTEG